MSAMGLSAHFARGTIVRHPAWTTIGMLEPGRVIENEVAFGSVSAVDRVAAGVGAAARRTPVRAESDQRRVGERRRPRKRILSGGS